MSAVKPEGGDATTKRSTKREIATWMLVTLVICVMATIAARAAYKFGFVEDPQVAAEIAHYYRTLRLGEPVADAEARFNAAGYEHIHLGPLYDDDYYSVSGSSIAEAWLLCIYAPEPEGMIVGYCVRTNDSRGFHPAEAPPDRGRLPDEWRQTNTVQTLDDGGLRSWILPVLANFAVVGTAAILAGIRFKERRRKANLAHGGIERSNTSSNSASDN